MDFERLLLRHDYKERENLENIGEQKTLPQKAHGIGGGRSIHKDRAGERIERQ